MTHLSVEDLSSVQELIVRLQSGEEMLLEQGGVAIGKLIPIASPVVELEVSRRIGFLEGQGSFPDDWKRIGMDDFEDAINKL